MGHCDACCRKLRGIGKAPLALAAGPGPGSLTGSRRGGVAFFDPITTGKGWGYNDQKMRWLLTFAKVGQLFATSVDLQLSKVPSSHLKHKLNMSYIRFACPSQSVSNSNEKSTFAERETRQTQQKLDRHLIA